MSQYSLATCDPLKAAKADRKDVRRGPHVTGSVSTVLFETGTMDTFAPSHRDTRFSSGDFITDPLLQAPWRSSSIAEDAEGEADEPLVTPTETLFRRQSVFGGPVVDSPPVSRASTMDEAATLLAHCQKEPASSSVGSLFISTKGAKKRPSPLSAAPTKGAEADQPDTTPVASPTTPSALVARAFGALFRSRR